MEIFITSDTHFEARIDKILDGLYDNGIKAYFENKQYPPLNEIVIVLMCREASNNFKQRIRMDKKAMVLYMDLMLDLDEFRVHDLEWKQKKVAQGLLSETARILRKYKLDESDVKRFETDLKKFLTKSGWI